LWLAAISFHATVGRIYVIDMMSACFNWVRILSFLLVLSPMLDVDAVFAEEKIRASAQCSVATLKGTYIYSSIGFLDGKPYAESGREVYDGKGGVELTYTGTGGVSGTMRTRYSVSPDCIGKAVYPYGQSLVSFISPDGSRFSYVMNSVSGGRPIALSGWEIRVTP
jgi:hypothetical protein